MKRFGRIVLWLSLLGLFGGGIVYSLWPQPVAVETVQVKEDKLEVSIREDGITRVREKYRVSSPVAGQLLRIELKAGDTIEASETLLATIRPSDPSMMDERQVAETEARAAAAKSAVERAEARRSQAKVASDLTETQFGRIQQLRKNNPASVPQEDFDTVEALFRGRQEELRIATFEQEIAQFEYKQAQAALGLIKPDNQGKPQIIEIHAPINGSVLRVFQESATVVTPGSELIEVGDPDDLEIVIDVLSSDAVKIQKLNTVYLEHWGGSEKLKAEVRMVEPAAFTKISALGVEEQRVNVIADFRETKDVIAGLGDGYRVEAAIVVWEKDNVLQVPTSALFRRGAKWCVFLADGDVAKLQQIEIGQRNEQNAEVVSGLTRGTNVIIYPSDLVKDGVKIAATSVDESTETADVSSPGPNQRR